MAQLAAAGRSGPQRAAAGRSGANVKAGQCMLGHASAAMTLDRYADLFDDDLDAVGQRLAAVRPADVARVSPDAKICDLDGVRRRAESR